MSKRIECRVVKVDEKATRCQRVGNTFRVDETIEGKLCARARKLVQAAAEQMQADGDRGARERDVFCPDNHILYRLTVVDGDAVGDEPRMNTKGHECHLGFSADRWQATRANHRAWWAGELERPLIHLTLPGRVPRRPEPALPAYGFTSFYDPDVSAREIAGRWLYDLECRHYLGDAFPHVAPNFGPGVIAAFLGLELQNGDNTVWFHQPEAIELADLELRFDPDNRWFRRVCDLYAAAAERFEGLVHLDMTDLGGNLDIVQSFRPGEALVLDLYDAPEAVARASWQAHEAWWNCFNELNRIIQPAHPGYTSWTPLYSEEPSYMLQCDFAYMIGTEMFDEFVKPELTATCRKLANPFYHLDGVGQLKHLDSLLQIPGLKGVQWVPGAGQPGVSEWPQVYRKIRDAGKLVQFFTSQDPLGWRALDVIARQLGSAKGLVMIGDAPAGDEPEIRELLHRYGAELGARMP